VITAANGLISNPAEASTAVTTQPAGVFSMVCDDCGGHFDYGCEYERGPDFHVLIADAKLAGWLMIGGPERLGEHLPGLCCRLCAPRDAN
jgi:hypothetical protein